MWIFQNSCFVSVVADKNDPSRLLVRSRIAGDVEKACPGAEVFQLDDADYRYRAFVGREELKESLCRAIDELQYTNFKDSVPKDQASRKRAYLNVWSAMASAFGAYGSGS